MPGHRLSLNKGVWGGRYFRSQCLYPQWDGHNDVLKANPAIGWDGYTNGHLENGATYVWMAGGIDYQGILVERRGTVIVVR